MSWKQKLRHSLAKTALVLSPLVFMFFVIEIGLRIFDRDPATVTQSAGTSQTADGFLHCLPDSQHGWIFPPNTAGDFNCAGIPTPTATNELGVRNRKLESGAAGARILVLGDSYAYGWGVHAGDAFPLLLEELATQRYPNESIEVINTGIPGYCPTQQRLMLERVHEIVPIACVVSTFSVANDPVDELRLARFFPDRLLEYSTDVRDPGSFNAWFIRQSKVLTIFNEKSLNLQFSLTNTRSSALRLARAAVVELIAACREKQIPLLLVVVPRASEVRDCNRIKKMFNFTTGRVRRLVHEIAAENEVTLLDLRAPLQAASEQGNVYLAHDPHWNQQGHRIVAQEIFEAIPESWLTGGTH